LVNRSIETVIVKVFQEVLENRLGFESSAVFPAFTRLKMIFLPRQEPHFIVGIS
jgi:hypothetical protein